MPHEIKYEGFPVRSPKMKKVFKEIADYAKQGYPVVLLGPSGSGKEFLAEYYFENYMQRQQQEGRFETINCATLVEGTAIGDLFGYKKGIFTSAYQDKKGLLEILNTGVLFLDEIGDLDQKIQPMFLRALNTNPLKREGRRIGGDESYLIHPGLCFVCATERPRESIRESLLFRMGAIIHVPGLNDRPEDVEPAMVWMFQKSLRSIRNYYTLLKKLDDNSQGTSIQTWDDFSFSVSRHLLPLVQSKEWKGNFRSLNAVINQSIIRSANSVHYNQLFDNTIRFFQEILPNYTTPLSGVSSSVSAPVAPAGFVDQETFDITLTKIAEIFPRMDNSEMVRIAEFLTSYTTRTFKRTDFELFVGVYKTARTAQKRLRELINSNLVSEHEKGFYVVKQEEMAKMEFRQVTSFVLPEMDCFNTTAKNAVDEILPVIHHCKGIYISTNGHQEIENVATCLGNALRNSYPIYYFSFGRQDVLSLVEAVKEEIVRKKHISGFEETWNKTDDVTLKIAYLTGYFEQLTGAEINPVFILEGVNRLFSSEQNSALLNVVKFWPFFRFVLIGDKMGNEFEGFTEFKVQ